MAMFHYKGRRTDGTTFTKTVHAPDRYAVYDIAREADEEVINVTESSGWSVRSLISVKKIEAFISRIANDDLVIITRNLGSMLAAGLPLSRALSVLSRQSDNPRLESVLADLEERIQTGDELNSALAAHPQVFDDLYVSMVRAGEEGGTLADTLSVLAVQLERSSTLKKKIKGAMIYPAIVLTIMVIIGILMMIFVMPSITSTFRKLEVDLPLTTQILINISEFLNNSLILVIGGGVLGVVGLIYLARTAPGKRIIHYVLLHIPVIGVMVKETNAARTARTLSSLLSSGVSMLRALAITKDVVQNVYYKPILAEAEARVEKGTALSQVFQEHEDLYPVFVGEMVLVGEETGQISEMLEKLAVYYETEVEQKTKNLSTIIEPLLMVVIGGTVGFFALSMIAPIYSIADSI